MITKKRQLTKSEIKQRKNSTKKTKLPKAHRYGELCKCGQPLSMHVEEELTEEEFLNLEATPEYRDEYEKMKRDYLQAKEIKK